MSVAGPLFGAMLLIAVTACGQPLSSAGLGQQAQDGRAVAAPKVASTSLARVADDCSIALPSGYRGPDPLSQEKSQPPSNPNVIAWSTGAWGTIDVSWRITRGGIGCFIENERTLPGQTLQPRTLTFQVSDREFDDIAATLNYARLNAMMTNCNSFMSDAETGSYDWYGTDRVSWVRFNKGDKCSGSDAFYQIMDGVTATLKAKAGR